MENIYYPSKDGRTTVHACMWQPQGEIKAIVQIVHGMAEYAERYSLFAEFLTERGYLVCAEDHLGHGKSVTDRDKLGYFTEGDGSAVVLDDIRQLTLIAKEKAAGVPLIIIGHSMGSFFTRKYISLYGEELAGAVIMGTGYLSKVTTSAGKFIARTIALFKGWEHRSKLVNKLSFGTYNKKVKDNKTEYDWLSLNEQNVQSYIADPDCGIMFTLSGFYTLFSIAAQACKKGTIKSVKKDLPLLILSGGDDPVGGYSKGVIKFYDKLVKNGVEDVELILYSDARHEILNDDCNTQVKEDILLFLERV
jgi:alpha-beta hydrolase superfamily lysophospholipase